MSSEHEELGLLGESLAEKLLRRAGMRVLARRFRVQAGELDLVMAEGRVIVFVEVKTLRSERAQDVVERVTASKQARMVRAARYYLRRHRLEDRACRFDVVTVVCPDGERPLVTHYPGAFEPGGW